MKIREDVLSELAVIQFVADHGDEAVFDVIVHPDTTAQDIALCRVELAQIAGQLADPDADRAALRARRSEVEDVPDELEARPPREGRIERVPTGETWRQRVDHIPDDPSQAEVLPVLCGCRPVVGTYDILPGLVGMPCEPCLINSPGPDEPHEVTA